MIDTRNATFTFRDTLLSGGANAPQGGDNGNSHSGSITINYDPAADIITKHIADPATPPVSSGTPNVTQDDNHPLEEAISEQTTLPSPSNFPGSPQHTPNASHNPTPMATPPLTPVDIELPIIDVEPLETEDDTQQPAMGRGHRDPQPTEFYVPGEAITDDIKAIDAHNARATFLVNMHGQA